MRKFLALVFCLFILFCPTIGKYTSYATSNEEISESTDEDYSEELEEEINEQLEDLDFSSLEDILNALTNGQINIFGGTSFVEKLQKLISGEFDNNQSLWSSIISIFFENLLGLLPIVSLIIAIALIGSMLQGLKPSNSGKSISNIIHFVTYGIIVVLVLSIVVKMVGLTTNTVQTIKAQMDAIFPILLTFLTAIGGTVSTSVYQPAMALLTGTIMNLFTYVLLPIFICCF